MKLTPSSILALAAVFFIQATTQLCEAVGAIPIWNAMVPDKGLTPMIHVSLPGGSSDIPMMVDTGSDAIAFCKSVEMSTNAESTGKYSCTSYGESTATEEEGWAGELYDTNLILGSNNETVLVSSVKVFQMEVYGNAGTTNICEPPSLNGIMGISPLSQVLYDALPTPTEISPAQCVITNNKSNTTLVPQFLSSVVTEDDQYTFGFLGMAPYRNSSTNHGDSVLAFGATAQQRVQDRVRTGSVSFAEHNTIETLTYQFAGPVTYEFVGLKDDDCEDLFLNGDCSYTFVPYTGTNVTDENKYGNAYIDSGTTALILPTVFQDSDFQPLITDDTMLTITVGDAALEFDADFLRYLIGKGMLFGEGYTGVNILGLPVFWKYDILFDVDLEKLKIGSDSSYGGVTFYERPLDDEYYATAAALPLPPPVAAPPVAESSNDVSTAVPMQRTAWATFVVVVCAAAGLLLVF